jgi:hypothetical protein
MGHAPPRSHGPYRPPTAESFHLHMARLAFLEGRMSVDEFERSVEHVLRGGTLTQSGRVPATRGTTYMVV